METLDNYRGNKAVLGLYQFIINRIPECQTFVELFAGSGAITKKLLSTAVTDSPDCWRLSSGQLVRTILNDSNASVVTLLKKQFPSPTLVTNLSAVQALIHVRPGTKDIFIYADPPYEFSTRGSNRRIYEHEMTVDDHEEFLTMAATVNCNLMISHYECNLYDTMLTGWNKETFSVSYHGKVKQECIYYNYPKPSKLLTYEYVGSDCWDRQRVKRKIDRLTKKLLALPEIERNAIINRVNKSLT